MHIKNSDPDKRARISSLKIAAIYTGELEQLNRTLLQEVQERKEAEERVKGVALFPEENPSPVLRVSADGTLLYANKAAAGLSRHCHCRVGEHVPDFMKREVAASLTSGRRRELEVDCEENVFLVILAPIPEKGYVNFYGTKHADARCVTITLGRCEGRVRLSISDDGRGFDSHFNRTSNPGSGWGLTIMRERAESVGARFCLDSKPGRGTVISVETREDSGCRSAS